MQEFKASLGMTVNAIFILFTVWSLFTGGRSVERKQTNGENFDVTWRMAAGVWTWTARAATQR